MTRRLLLQLPAAAAAQSSAAVPWYRKTLRWGQTNITEKDPDRYDIPWWRAYWKRTAVQGVIINAGGIVAYYPSKFPLQYQAAYLRGRDLYGDLAKAARADGLVVLARMDSNRATEDFYRAHPDWFAVDASGKPYRAAERYVACINGPYYEEFLPAVITEIVERSKPQGVTDNSWAGLDRKSICYCPHCATKFRAATTLALPRAADWNDRAYREWIVWSYARRLAIWDLNNATTKRAGGPDCLWIGMNTGSVLGTSNSLRDMREIGRRAEILLLDHQRREDSWGFAENADAGKRVHAVMGWDKLAPESMAMYQSGPDSFRLAAKPAPEARMWMFAGFAGGIQPWWHHVGAFQEDRRAFATAEPVMRWHQANDRYLVNRKPVATVGLAWSQRNTDFYGRDDAARRTESAYRGMAEALIRARIPYVPVNIEDIRETRVSTLMLPCIGAMSDAQCKAVRDFASRGGSIVATGPTSGYDEWGDPRPDLGLADLLGVHRRPSSDTAAPAHTYLRIESRKPVLQGFDDTDILAFGETLDAIEALPGRTVALTYIPPFPTYPPEFAYMREERTTIPGLVLSEQNGGRIAYLAAPLDRCYARDHLPDHARLIANLVRWCDRDRSPLRVDGPGLIDCELYEQDGRFILHLLNLNNEAAWRQPIAELLPVGPYRIAVRGPRGNSVRALVSGAQLNPKSDKGWTTVDLPRLVDHEVIVFE